MRLLAGSGSQAWHAVMVYAWCIRAIMFACTMVWCVQGGAISLTTGNLFLSFYLVSPLVRSSLLTFSLSQSFRSASSKNGHRCTSCLICLSVCLSVCLPICLFVSLVWTSPVLSMSLVLDLLAKTRNCFTSVAVERSISK